MRKNKIMDILKNMRNIEIKFCGYAYDRKKQNIQQRRSLSCQPLQPSHCYCHTLSMQAKKKIQQHQTPHEY